MQASCSGDEDGASLELAFSKKKIEERKAWLAGYMPGTFLDMRQEHITYSDFVNQVRSSCFHLEPAVMAAH